MKRPIREGSNELFETKMMIRCIDYGISIEVPSPSIINMLRAAVYGRKLLAICLIHHLCKASLLDAKNAVVGYSA
jgi:hypothetical protein